MLAKRLVVLSLALGAAGAVFLLRAPEAEACGCFAPPDPSVPVVQAGENILFSIENGQVVAHIQVQYAGPASEFGWLLPLPSVPEMELGTDELFAQLIATTQPKFVLDREYRGDCPFDPNRGGFGGSDSADGDPSPPAGEGGGGGNPLVLQDSIGPYDYAVLRADSKDEMLAWLTDNGYFIPVGTEDVVDAYIQPGAYFLALRLQKGNDVGDLQPVRVAYESDLPMIPIVLTSVAADPDMGIQVWMLGDARAIPRNYFHTTVNDAFIDWLDFGANYADVVTAAVNEADEGHSFVTEYAGTSGVMVDILDPAWRFGDPTYLRTLVDAVDYVNYLVYNGYGLPQNAPPFGTQFSSQMLAILGRHLPMPAKLAAEGVTANDYYGNFEYYVVYDRENRPDVYDDLDLEFDPAVMTDEIEERFIAPTRAAGQQFRDWPYLTRLYTTLSPEEMTKDPVFSFNPDLGDYGNEHRGRLIYYCYRPEHDQPGNTPARLITEAGFVMGFPNGTDEDRYAGISMPSSQYTGVLREEGVETFVSDNTRAIQEALAAYEDGGGGCSIAGRRSAAPIALALLGLVGTAVVRRRRRR